jgi:DNA primase
MLPFSSREQVKNMVKEAADIVAVIGEHVELKRAGARLTGLCPFHAEKTPSFSVNPQGQFYHCFGCGESGDVFSFMMKYHNMEFPEALKELARKFHIDLPEDKPLSEAEQARLRQREALYAINERAAIIFQECLDDQRLGKPARNYLGQRGVPVEIIARYRLGFAPDPEHAGWGFLSDRLLGEGFGAEQIEAAGLAVRKDRGGHYDRFRSRVLFPISDMTGRVVAFGGRVLGEGGPKYMNSPESPIFDKGRLLFGLYQHREAIRRERRALVVEGNFDLLLLAVHGIDNVVAPLGTSLTRSHIHSLRGYGSEVVLLFDADAAGLKAAMRSVPYFLAEQVEARVALLPSGHDPDSFVRAEGPKAVAELVRGARPLPEFILDALIRQHGLTLGGKNRIIGELKPLVREAADAEQRNLMIAHFSEKLGVSPGYFAGEAGGRTRPTDPEPGVRPAALLTLPRQEQQLVDFLILYPEYLEKLQAAGLGRMALHPATVRLLGLLGRMVAADLRQPEHLLSMDLEEQERTYVVRLLTNQPPFSLEDREEHARELTVWLQSSLRKQAVADLQQQILEAGRLGNTALLMELMRLKQDLERKRMGL